MIDGKTEKYCLIGDPVEHSLSPLIMNTLFRRYRINSIYFVCRVPQRLLEEAVKGIIALDIKGVNVTMPNKEAIIKYLNDLSDDTKVIGAVNTIKNIDGILIGYNTDWLGILRTLISHGYKGFDRCVILGAGGAAKAALYAVIELCKELIIINRTVERAVKLAERFRGLSDRITVMRLSTENIMRVVPTADLVINATPIGMDGVSSPIPREAINSGMVIFDLIYSPLNTPLLTYASENGAEPIDGLWMLIYQALEAFKIWTGKSPEVGELRKILEEVV